MIKIAIPTCENVVDNHFGHCEFYTIFTVNNNTIENTETLPAPQGCGCKSNIASILQQKGVNIMLAGNMGVGALNVLNTHGIKVYRGCSGNVKQVAELFIEGKIEDSGIGCSHHNENENEHQCNH